MRKMRAVYANEDSVKRHDEEKDKFINHFVVGNDSAMPKARQYFLLTSNELMDILNEYGAEYAAWLRGTRFAHPSNDFIEQLETKVK